MQTTKDLTKKVLYPNAATQQLRKLKVGEERIFTIEGFEYTEAKDFAGNEGFQCRIVCNGGVKVRYPEVFEDKIAAGVRVKLTAEEFEGTNGKIKFFAFDSIVGSADANPRDRAGLVNSLLTKYLREGLDFDAACAKAEAEVPA